MRILRNKLFIGCVCILLAVLVGFVLIPSLNKQQTGTVTVLQIKQAIMEGERIDPESLQTVAVPQSAAPKDAVKNAADVEGKLAAHDLYAGDFLTSGELAASQDIHDVFQRVRRTICA